MTTRLYWFVCRSCATQNFAHDTHEFLTGNESYAEQQTELHRDLYSHDAEYRQVA